VPIDAINLAGDWLCLQPVDQHPNEVVKRRLIFFSLMLGTATTFAQGLINFFNTSTTLVSTSDRSGQSSAISAPPGTYYFGLLTSSIPSGTFTFSGLYATNLAVGRFTGGNGVAVSGWAEGTLGSYEIAGWSSVLGHDLNPDWLNGNFAAAGYFGLSAIGTGRSGCVFAHDTCPNLNLFGGTGITTGFTLYQVPEPSTIALATLGAATLMIRRRNSWAKSQAVRQ